MADNDDTQKDLRRLWATAAATNATRPRIDQDPRAEFGKFLDQLVGGKLLQKDEAAKVREAGKSGNPVLAVKQMEDALLDIEPNLLGLVRNRTGHVKS